MLLIQIEKVYKIKVKSFTDLDAPINSTINKTNRELISLLKLITAKNDAVGSKVFSNELEEMMVNIKELTPDEESSIIKLINTLL